MQYKLVVSKYYSEKRGLVKPRRNWYAINKDIFDKYGLEVIRR